MGCIISHYLDFCFFLDSKGDAMERYKLVNIQKVTKGTIEVATFGYYDTIQPRRLQFTMNNVNIVWGGHLMSKLNPQVLIMYSESS